MDDETRKASQRLADEKAEVWPDLLKIWPAWTAYTERSGRDLRVFKLQRVGQSS